MPDEANESKEEALKKIRELIWKNALLDKCRDCGADVLVPLLGPFQCKACGGQFRKAAADLIGHHDFNIDQEKDQGLILGAMHEIIARDDEDMCYACGATYPKEFKICPALLQFALRYYCEPEEKRLPQTRDRIVAKLQAHELAARRVIADVFDEKPELWKSLNASGLFQQLPSEWRIPKI